MDKFPFYIEQIDRQIEFHGKVMDSVEQIRWRFTTAFGFTALVGLIFISGKFAAIPLSQSQILAYLVVAGVAIAGLFTQITIAGLLWSQWNRIRGLQQEKIVILEENGVCLSESVKDYWSIPKIVPRESSNRLHPSIHVANCFLFSLLFSVSVAHALNRLLACEYSEYSEYFAATIICVLTAVLTFFGRWAGMRYYKKLVADR